MEMSFELPVMYKGEEREYKARAVVYGYTYRFYILVDDTELIFEKDDEQQFRVLQESPGTTPPDPALLSAIIDSLQQLSN